MNPISLILGLFAGAFVAGASEKILAEEKLAKSVPIPDNNPVLPSEPEPDEQTIINDSDDSSGGDDTA